jgi:phosphonate transport system substrate-binding protein
MKKLSIAIALIVLLPCSCLAANRQLSMLPLYYPERLTKMITPLAGYLSDTTGDNIKTILTDNFADYESSINQGAIDIGYENPMVYVKVSQTQEVVAMAIKGEDGDRFRGIIITRPDSGIQSLADLRGKTVMIVGETSAGGYLSQKLSLLEAGIDISELVVQTAAGNHQENVIISVAVGDVDAGFIRESAFHMADKYIMPGSVKTIAETAWLPNWALSVRRDLEEEYKEQIRKAVTGLKENHPVLNAMGLKGFRVASDEEYNLMRKAMNR